jgi:glycosyltransferase involved in cell wall biosynthesis
MQRFDPANLSSQGVTRKQLEVGLPNEAKVVGFVGRLVQEKGLLDLFAAARIVREQVPEVRFLFVGPVDTHKPDALTPDTAQEYGIGDVCYFLGMRQGMPELYALMDVFVLPSHREGFPRAPMEASAMKVPCVVTDIRGCREVVEHGQNGLLVALGDVQALAEAIIELLTDWEKARRMGEEGRRMALERFDERLVFEKVKAEYARLLQERGLPAPEPRSVVEAAS